MISIAVRRLLYCCYSHNHTTTAQQYSGGAFRTYDLALKVSGQYGVLLPLHPGRNCDFELKNGSGFGLQGSIRFLCRGRHGRQWIL